MGLLPRSWIAMFSMSVVILVVIISWTSNDLDFPASVASLVAAFTAFVAMLSPSEPRDRDRS